MPYTPENLNLHRRFITTAIPYVNAAPHVGFALEIVQADVLARFYRQSGDDVRFLTGTDENSLKNVQAAELLGVSVETLVESNAEQFQQLEKSLELSFDDFIRTSADARHQPGATRLWAACAKAGDIYKRIYRGLYCTGCEQFYKSEELIEGRCPEHGTKPDEVEEENWFFRLSRYSDRLREIYARQEIEVVPAPQRNEILAWIDGGLEDFSISRSARRARGWGILVPNDTDQVMYVWFDALANYITALGYGTDECLLQQYWNDATSREHVIGKGITRFHAIYWPAILLSAGLKLPTRILVHGYVTVEGRKIGKSAGNAIDPIPLASEFGTDALRYYLLRHIRPTADGDFSHERFRQAYVSELADQLGNLTHRVLGMIERYCGAIVPTPSAAHFQNDGLLVSSSALSKTVANNLASFAFDKALDAIWISVADANRYVTEHEPWKLSKAAVPEQDLEFAAACETNLHNVLFSLAASLLTIGQTIAPLLPDTSRQLMSKLGSAVVDTPSDLPGRKVEAGAPLFPK